MSNPSAAAESSPVSSSGKRPVFVGNWKLFGTVSESVALAAAVEAGVREWPGSEVVLAPGFLAIPAVVQNLLQNLSQSGLTQGPAESRISVAGQDCHWETKGAFTGEVSATQLKDVGCRYVIIGHSERRALMGETDADVNRKAIAALAAGLLPIVCVGETLVERDSQQTLSRIGVQLEAALAGLSEDQAARILVAYEPVWAIGTGRTASPEQAEEVHAFIRYQMKERFPAAAQSLPILYGGSVKPDNIQALMAEQNIDGALVGGASLSAESFVRIVKEGTAVWSRS